MRFRLKLILILPLLFGNGSFFLSQITSDWEVFNSSNSPITNNTIRCLAVDSNNTIWIGTDHGLFNYNQGIWNSFNTQNSELTDDYIRSLAVDYNNHIWIGTTLSGIFKYDGSSWTNYNTSNSDIADNFIRTISFSPSHELWIGTVEGLCRYNLNTWTTWTIANSGLLSNNITSIAFDQAGIPCVTTINGGIFYIVNDNPMIYTLATSNLPDNSSIAVQYDIQNKPWFASTAQGIFTETGNQIWLTFNVSNSAIPTNSLTAFEIDHFQNFLIGSHQNGVIIRTNNSDWVNFDGQNSPLPDNFIHCITRDSTENIWVGTDNGGLVRFRLEFSEIEEQSFVDHLEVYPNPVSNQSSLHFSVDVSNYQVTLTDIHGRSYPIEMSQQGDISSLKNITPGIYRLVFIGEKSQFVKKLVVVE
jgi:ligand-binding sensor domain-containing protein